MRRERDRQAEERKADAMTAWSSSWRRRCWMVFSARAGGLEEKPPCGEPDTNTSVMRNQRRSKPPRIWHQTNLGDSRIPGQTSRVEVFYMTRRSKS